MTGYPYGFPPSVTQPWRDRLQGIQRHPFEAERARRQPGQSGRL